MKPSSPMLLPVAPRGQRPASRQLLREHLGAPGVVELAVRGVQLAEAVEQRLQRRVVEVRVLADVDAGQVQPDGVRRAHDVAQPAVGDPLALVGAQRAVHDDEVAQVLVGPEVVAPRLVRGALDVAAPGVLQPRVDVGALEPVGLLGVEPHEPVVDLRQRAAVAGEAAPQVLADPDQPRRHRQLLDEVLEQLGLDAHAALAVDPHRLERQLGGDVGVAVAVAADPAAQDEGPRALRQVQAHAGELLVELGEHLGHGAASELVEVVGHRAGLVEHRRTLGADLVGLPDEVDETVQPDLGLLLGQAAGQDVRDRPELAQHRLALRLRRVRGERRLDLEARQRGVELVRVGVGDEPVARPRAGGRGPPRAPPRAPRRGAAARRGSRGGSTSRTPARAPRRCPGRARRAGRGSRCRPSPGPRARAGGPSRRAPACRRRAAPRPCVRAASRAGGCPRAARSARIRRRRCPRWRRGRLARSAVRCRSSVVLLVGVPSWWVRDGGDADRLCPRSARADTPRVTPRRRPPGGARGRRGDRGGPRASGTR